MQVWENMAAFVSGLSGVLLGAGIIAIWLQQVLRGYERLKEKVEQQLEERMHQAEIANQAAELQYAQLASRLEAAEIRLEPVNGPLLNQQIQSIGRQLDAVDAKLDRYREATARLEERMEGLRASCEAACRQGRRPGLAGLAE